MYIFSYFKTEDESMYLAVSKDGFRWESRSIGYAYSDNLKDWNGHKLLPVMGDIAGAVNAWTPEIFWDKAQGKHRIIWSSTGSLKRCGLAIWNKVGRIAPIIRNRPNYSRRD